MKVKEELDKIGMQLSSLSELRKYSDSVTTKLQTRLENAESKYIKYQTQTDEKLTTIEVTEARNHNLAMDKLNSLENNQRSLNQKLEDTSTTNEGRDKKISELEKIIMQTGQEMEKIKKTMIKIQKNKPNLAELGEEMNMRKNELEQVSEKVEKLIEEMNKNRANEEEIEKIKTKGEEISERIDRIQKEDNMMNLLMANLPPQLQTIQGFAGFSFNELNVELARRDVMFLSKVFESQNRIVHLIRFRRLEIRNAIFRGRVNLGYRSKIWINEDLIPGKVGIALGARRRYRAGKIAKNWTFQGDVFITMPNDPNPIKITCESDFRAETALNDGEGMLPR